MTILELISDFLATYPVVIDAPSNRHNFTYLRGDEIEELYGNAECEYSDKADADSFVVEVMEDNFDDAKDVATIAEFTYQDAKVYVGLYE